MNKRGGIFLAFMVGLLILMVGLLFVNFITPEITTARDSNNLDCGNTTITDGTKLTCLVVDAVAPYYIIVILAAAGGAIVSQFMQGRKR